MKTIGYFGPTLHLFIELQDNGEGFVKKPLLTSYQQTDASFSPDPHFSVIVFIVWYNRLKQSLINMFKIYYSLSLSTKTLWNILEEPNIVNTSEFEDLFSKTTTQTKTKPLSEAYEKKAKTKKVKCKINLNITQDAPQFLWFI